MVGRRALATLAGMVAFVAGARAQHAGHRMDDGMKGSTPEEKAFLAESDAGMNRMMTDMAVKPSGSVDRDFVAMMVPHHQGAIAMAQAYLKHGNNEKLRGMAQAIVAAQSQEIGEMRAAIGGAA